jgi:hypothetical protein
VEVKSLEESPGKIEGGSSDMDSCGGTVSSDRLFGFLSEKIIQFVIVEAVEM